MNFGFVVLCTQAVVAENKGLATASVDIQFRYGSKLVDSANHI